MRANLIRTQKAMKRLLDRVMEAPMITWLAGSTSATSGGNAISSSAT